MTVSFADRVALVTGAGGGLGRAHALELARRGASVVVNDLGGSRDGTGGSSSAADAVVQEIIDAGGKAVANPGSVSDEKQAAEMVQQAIDQYGRLDIVINNAGILRDKSFAKASMDDFRTVVDVHLLGSAYVTKAAWGYMREQNYGRIVMTTSTSGLFGNFGQTNYGAAKLGLVGMMNTLRFEGAKYNIHVNAIAPIATTRMTDDIFPDDIKDTMKPELVTPGVVYLCSEEAPNGFVMQAAGGRFFAAAILENYGVDLGADATVEDVAANFEAIADMSNPKERLFNPNR